MNHRVLLLILCTLIIAPLPRAWGSDNGGTEHTESARSYSSFSPCNLCYLRVSVVSSPTNRSEELLPEGARIRVKAGSEVREKGAVVPLATDNWITGRLVQKDVDFLTIETSSKSNLQRKLPISTLHQLQVSQGRGRKKAALIGAGIGAAAGLIFGAIDSAECKSSGDWFCGFSYYVTVLTIPAGALIGLAVGTEKWATVPVEGMQRPQANAPSIQIVYKW